MAFIPRRVIDEKVKSTISTVTDLKALEKEVSDGKSSQGTGGMQSKIEAAEILKKEGNRNLDRKWNWR